MFPEDKTKIHDSLESRWMTLIDIHHLTNKCRARLTRLYRNAMSYFQTSESARRRSCVSNEKLKRLEKKKKKNKAQ